MAPLGIDNNVFNFHLSGKGLLPRDEKDDDKRKKKDDDKSDKDKSKDGDRSKDKDKGKDDDGDKGKSDKKGQDKDKKKNDKDSKDKPAEDSSKKTTIVITSVIPTPTAIPLETTATVTEDIFLVYTVTDPPFFVNPPRRTLAANDTSDVSNSTSRRVGRDASSTPPSPMSTGVILAIIMSCVFFVTLCLVLYVARVKFRYFSMPSILKNRRVGRSQPSSFKHYSLGVASSAASITTRPLRRPLSPLSHQSFSYPPSLAVQSVLLDGSGPTTPIKARMPNGHGPTVSSPRMRSQFELASRENERQRGFELQQGDVGRRGPEVDLSAFSFVYQYPMAAFDREGSGESSPRMGTGSWPTSARSSTFPQNRHA